jgi:flagellar P-ring protein FlgI
VALLVRLDYHAEVEGMTKMKAQHSTGVRRALAVFIVFAAVGAACLAPVYDCAAARIKDLANIGGVRPNILIGYGLVVGLNRTGDKTNTLFTNQSLSNMLEKMGVIVDPKATKVNNVAAVMVTAEMPPFARTGNKIDVTISSLGDATSLEGGVLLMTPLKGGNGQTYAVAQGPLTLGGYSAGGQAASVQKNHPTVGRIPNGAIVEQEIGYDNLGSAIKISLKRPDFTNARKMADSINGTFRGAATAEDGGTVIVSIPESMRRNAVKFLSVVENLEIKPENFAKIVVDEKTGTIVIGEDVRIDTVAISHGNVTVQIKEDQKVSQPMPFSEGKTVVTPETQMKVEEEKGHFVRLQGGVKIKELVDALNAVGLSARDMITILRTIKAAGALHAELEVI